MSLAGIRIWGNNITLRRNLVMMTLWPGSYQGREEAFNYDWNAAIEVCASKLFTTTKHVECFKIHDECVWLFQVSQGSNVVLQYNIVAGYERVAYRIDGEPCPGNTVR